VSAHVEVLEKEDKVKTQEDISIKTIYEPIHGPERHQLPESYAVVSPEPLFEPSKVHIKANQIGSKNRAQIQQIKSSEYMMVVISIVKKIIKINKL
jgi:hypothetical protein